MPTETFPKCRGSTCDNGMRCIEAGACQYKSSADEFRELTKRIYTAPTLLNPGPQTDTPKDDPTAKPSNPKDLIGSNKIPMHLWPAVATAYGSLGLLDGMLKYGRSNWRESGVRATIYVDALIRHALRWLEGLDDDPDSGLPQFAHMLACVAILADAKATGKLVDDRLYSGAGVIEELERLTPHVARLKALHKDKSPRHYTIADNTPEGTR